MNAAGQKGLFASEALPPPRQKSTIRPPPKKWLAHWHVGLIDDDTVRDLLERGESLGFYCRGCRRLVEITPPELEEKFGTKLGARIRNIAPRLRCSGEDGCRSDDIAVFPHLYDDAAWRWAPPAED